MFMLSIELPDYEIREWTEGIGDDGSCNFGTFLYVFITVIFPNRVCKKVFGTFEVFGEQ